MKPIVIGDLNLVRCFGLAKIPFVVLTDHGRSVTFSRYCHRGYDIPNPEQESDAAYDVLKNVASATAGRKPLYYSNDGHLKMIIDHYDDVCERFCVALPSKEIISACLDKQLFSDFALKHELPVPPVVELQVGTKIQETGPLVLKPITRVNWWHNTVVQKKLGSKYKAITIRDDDELQYWMGFLEDANVAYMAQVLVDGPESNIFSYHAFIDDEFLPLATFIGRKIRTAPVHNGRSSYLSLVRNEALETLGNSIVRKVKIKGPVKIDFKYDEASNIYYVLEINPRYNLWHYLGAVSGVNIPAIAYSYHTGMKITSKTSLNTTRIRWLDFATDRKAYVEMRLNGETNFLQWLWSLRGEKVFNDFSWTDPLPFLHRFAKRLINKVRRVAGKAFGWFITVKAQ